MWECYAYCHIDNDLTYDMSRGQFHVGFRFYS